MKTKFTLLFITVTHLAVSQIKVSSSGNLGIGTLTPSAKLTIESSGGVPPSSLWTKYFTTADYCDAVKSQVDRALTKAIIVYNTSTGAAWYVEGGGNTWSSGYSWVGSYVSATSYQTRSDRKLKNNIRTCDNALDKILQLRGVNYTLADSVEVNYTTAEIDSTGLNTTPSGLKSPNPDAAKNRVKYISKKMKIAVSDSADRSKMQYGFVAQEVETILPDVVKVDKSTGLKTVNYNAVIPLLVEALKQQNQKIDNLEAEIKKIKNKTSSARVDNTTNSIQTLAGAWLYQNTPNPFSAETQIRYFLPDHITESFITVNDLNGKQLKLIKLSTKGEGSVTLKASELPAGIYLYALVVDGNMVDTKRMLIIE